MYLESFIRPCLGQTQITQFNIEEYLVWGPLSMTWILRGQHWVVKLWRRSGSRRCLRASPVTVSLASGRSLTPISLPFFLPWTGRHSKKRNNKPDSTKISKTHFALYTMIYCPANPYLFLYTLLQVSLYATQWDCKALSRAREDNTLCEEEKPYFTH